MPGLSAPISCDVQTAAQWFLGGWSYSAMKGGDSEAIPVAQLLRREYPRGRKC